MVRYLRCSQEENTKLHVVADFVNKQKNNTAYYGISDMVGRAYNYCNRFSELRVFNHS